MSENEHSECPVCAGAGVPDFTGTDLMFGGERRFDYHRCESCGLIYQHPLPSGAEIAGFYPDSYSIYSEPLQPVFSARALRTLRDKKGYAHLEIQGEDTLLDHLRPGRAVPEVVPYVPGGRALDIGCGNGEFLLRLRSIGWQVQGAEFNEKAVGICRSHGLDVFHGDLKAAAFASGSFDFVSANHLIEHVPDPHGLMQEIARVTRRGGHVLIRTPNSEALGRRWMGSWWFANDVPRHLMLYSKHNLRLLADRHGLETESVSTPVKPKILLKSLDYRFGKRDSFKKCKALQWLVRAFVPAARLTGRGDELFAMFVKR